MKRLAIALTMILLTGFAARAATVTDALGRTVTFDVPFSRIVSLYPAHTENLLTMGAGKRLIGVSRSDAESTTQARAVLGSRDGAERFLALSPDLVLIRPMHERAHPGIWETLRRQGVTVLALQPNTPEEMYAYWLALGRLSGREAEAETMVNDFRTGLADLQKRNKAIPHTEKPMVFFEAIHRYYRTFSPGSMPMLVLEAAGGINAVPDAPSRHGSNIADCGKERLLAAGHRIDAYVAQVGRMNAITRDEILNEPGFEAIRAVREGRVFLVDEALVSRPTPKLLDAARKLRGLLYNN
ncbi:ABC transporter substrate-binding protein [Salidesulfovibrio brasiliensis]|uniref:ABC transporter substrate-binding protein n=1 Tax=Salidesulfovibrio brasiliensis TaxID=221711 RepID=UPI0006CFB77D|nr:ABC transporter substrate-binding protein [Salidesulfovibrio brasiliensis]